MIHISVDEGFAYDLLSILQIKMEKNPDNDQARLNHRMLDNSLLVQIKDHSTIKASPEYKSLVAANLAVFNHIDQYKQREEQVGDASFIDLHNYKRWECKRALQTTHFPYTEFREQKFGYGEAT